MINGGYAKQHSYTPIPDLEALQEAMFFAEKNNVSRTGRYWGFLQSEAERLFKEDADRRGWPSQVSSYYLDQY